MVTWNLDYKTVPKEDPANVTQDPAEFSIASPSLAIRAARSKVTSPQVIGENGENEENSDEEDEEVDERSVSEMLLDRRRSV
jgi:hypothetical protein